MSEEQKPELLPCPFCGSGAEWSYSWWAVAVCLNRDCKVMVMVAVNEFPSAEAAVAAVIKKWNTRAGEDERIAAAVAAERARLRSRAQQAHDKCMENAASAPESEAWFWEDNADSWRRFMYVVFDKKGGNPCKN